MSTPNVLLVTKGHPFERDAFFSMFDGLEVNWTHVEQPAARVFFAEEFAADYDALVMYDMPGIHFVPDGPDREIPTDEYKNRLLSLLQAGKGMVFMHHAIAGWPAWEEYAEIVGGRFLYLPDKLRGEEKPDSGYRHKVEHKISVLTDHPITQGLPKQFPMTDELYLSEIFEDSIEPLLASDYEFTRNNFYSATKAVKDGKMFDNEGWEHPDGSNIVGWVKHYGNSPIAYIQGGDDPEAYASEYYQRLLQNAINWAASPAALQWARDRD
jgi:type 1 glutamine amidotransferase